MRYHGALSSTLNRMAEIWAIATGAKKDELGQCPKEERCLAKVWAGVTPQTGSLLSGRVSDTQLSRTTHKVTLRYRKDLTPDMWLVIEGQRYDILYILDPYLAHERLEVFCEVVL